ncbi:alkyl/aryl-sulfatase [Marinobacter sp. LN3S78]|uniref:alkyl/aryl-sulfatase n=1 Tax=Marinobacter sp. LN3S78 TaxID=3382300 RepID=UPI00387ACA05
MTRPSPAADSGFESRDAEPETIRKHQACLQSMPFEDDADFEDAWRGLVARPHLDAVERDNGKIAWDFRAYEFQQTEQAPLTVHPSLWRLARLNNIAGLFRVTDRIYQIRGFDLSNMNIIEGDTGLIVMDPLVSTEVASAGMDLYFQHRPRKPVVSVIYTHCHVDHFGGVKGVVDEADVKAGKVSILAPDGFMEEAVSENIMAGPAMGRRAQYMYGGLLPKGPKGQVDAGLGKATSRGTVTLIAPTDLVSKSIETRVIDGLEMELQLTPGTEAPAEMNLYFPSLRALCVAENACRCQHNILTIRGAQVRDPKIWSYYLGETLARYGDRSDVLFAQHHWPTWGQDNIRTFLEDQRDMYAFLNDETLRLLNHGLTPLDIADHLRKLPDPVAQRWYSRDYYGSVSHNVRAVYQRYMGFYDANPANLNPLPTVESARRHVDWMGGAERVLERAQASFDKGDFRWVAEIVNKVVFADPDNQAARQLQADALEQLGYQCENTTWRNAYLTGAMELRNGVRETRSAGGVPHDLIKAITPSQFFDVLAVRLDAGKVAGQEVAINWRFSDTGTCYALTLRNGVLTHRQDDRFEQPDVEVTTIQTLLPLIGSKPGAVQEALQSGDIRVQGDGSRLMLLLSSLDRFSGRFNIVTPAKLPE